MPVRHLPWSRIGAGSGGRRSGRGSLAAIALVLWAVCLCTALGLRKRASEEGFGWIDPSLLTLGELGDGCDPRWGRVFEDLAASFPLLRSDDEEGIAELVAAVDDLSFVREVHAAEVLWPDGLALEVSLHLPVACVPVGERFQPIADDGTLLPGMWPVPPIVRGQTLPVVGPLDDGHDLFLHARAGDFLAEPEHLAALDVALSISEHLSEDDRRLLGAVVIDASGVDEFGEPNVRIELACGRSVIFGRAPSVDAPGELPVERKWIGVAHALEELEPQGPNAQPDPSQDWRSVDVRWDHPELHLMSPIVAQADPVLVGTRGGRPSPSRSMQESAVPDGAPPRTPPARQAARPRVR